MNPSAHLGCEPVGSHSEDKFTGVAAGMPPGWSFCPSSSHLGSGTLVNDAPPNRVDLSKDTCISSNTTFDPSAGGRITWRIHHSGATGGREVQYSIYLIGQNGNVLDFWFNREHANGHSRLLVNGNLAPQFSSELPTPAIGYKGMLYFDDVGVQVWTEDGIDVSYTWAQIAGASGVDLDSFGTVARVGIQGRPTTVQQFGIVKVRLNL